MVIMKECHYVMSAQVSDFQKKKTAQKLHIIQSVGHVQMPLDVTFVYSDLYFLKWKVGKYGTDF